MEKTQPTNLAKMIYGKEYAGIFEYYEFQGDVELLQKLKTTPNPKTRIEILKKLKVEHQMKVLMLNGTSFPEYDQFTAEEEFLLTDALKNTPIDAPILNENKEDRGIYRFSQENASKRYLRFK